MVGEVTIETTADGSNTLYVPAMNEHYHSVKGARTESQYIFLECGLMHSSAPAPRILEIGFGTGLNAFLTLLYSNSQHRSVHYTTLEKYPLSLEMALKMGYTAGKSETEQAAFRALHTATWGEEVELSAHFTIEKVATDFLAYDFASAPFDVVYFDAFAPEKQPHLWQQDFLQRIYDHLSPQGVLTTYCAKGEVRRTLQRVGFTVERLAGPPNGKREILRAVRS